MKTNEELNILVTGGIPGGMIKGNIGELTEYEEKQIRINVMTANEKLKLVKMTDYLLAEGIWQSRVNEMTDIEIEKCYKAMKMMDGWH